MTEIIIILPDPLISPLVTPTSPLVTPPSYAGLTTIIGGVSIALGVLPGHSPALQAVLTGLANGVSLGTVSLSAYSDTLPATLGASVSGTTSAAYYVGTPSPTVTPTIAVTVYGGATIAVTPPVVASSSLSTYVQMVLNGDTSSRTVALQSATVPVTIISGRDSKTVFLNRSTNASVILIGGNDYVGNADASSSISVTLNSYQYLGDGRLYLDATIGTANVTVGNNGLLAINSGAQTRANVVASGGTIVVSASNRDGRGGTVPSAAVSIAGATTSGARLIFIPDGGRAVINPNASDVVIAFGHPYERSGSETLLGGTGSATVFAGTGSFTGGSGGNNIMLTSTLNGTTTLIGGGRADSLWALGGGDVIQGGTGAELMVGIGAASVPGNLFITGIGSDTVLGGIGGGNTIEFGGGSALVYGQHGIASVFSGLTSNLYQLYAAGGSDTIGDFVIGKDAFKISGTIYANGAPIVGGAVSVASSAISGADLVITLSDQTRITFSNGASFNPATIFS